MSPTTVRAEQQHSCVCEWGPECDGSGLVRCRGCWKRPCACPCGGETSCLGCKQCDPHEGDWNEDET